MVTSNLVTYLVTSICSLQMEASSMQAIYLLIINQHCKKQSVYTTLIGVTYDTVGVLIIITIDYIAMLVTGNLVTW